jgi:tRNA G18 (ribose-2'-O)-methylase SpoU
MADAAVTGADEAGGGISLAQHKAGIQAVSEESPAVCAERFATTAGMRCIEAVTDTLSPVVAHYRNLKDTRAEVRRGLFIAEGVSTIQLLLRSELQCVSLLVRPSALAVLAPDVLERQRRSHHAARENVAAAVVADPVVVDGGGGGSGGGGGGVAGDGVDGASDDQTGAPPHRPGCPTKVDDVRILVATKRVISTIVDFPCRGVLACGVIPPGRDEQWLDEHVLAPLDAEDDARLAVGRPPKQWRITAIDGSFNHNNVGSIVRTSSAFGATCVLLSHDTCDVWYRAAVRVSMGHVFRLPVVRCESLAGTLRRLHARFGVESYAAVIDDDEVQPVLLHALGPGSSPRRWCCVVGNEDRGVCLQVRQACQHRLRVDMQPDVDSVAITVATGVVLNGLREREATTT